MSRSTRHISSPLHSPLEVQGHTSGSLTTLLTSAGVPAELLGRADLHVTHFAAVDQAGESSITFVRTDAYAKSWAAGRATAALTTGAIARSSLPRGASDLPPGKSLIVVRDVDEAAAVILGLFSPAPRPRRTGVHPTAAVDPDARVSADAEIGPHCVVEAGARIGAGTSLIAGVYVGRDALVGDRTTLHPGVKVLDRCRVGNDCILHAGVVIGADGFGYRPGPKGLVKIPHIGDAVIEDHVEIGANSCVDRAKFGSTIIGLGTKIDNLVQIAHNCRVGRHCVLCAHVGIAGSVVLGDGVVLGGLVGVADGVEIGAGARVSAHSGVAGDVPAGAEYMGIPAGPVSDWRRNYVVFGKLHERLAELKSAIKKLDRPS